MLSINALNYVTGLEIFREKALSKDVDIDYCLEIRSKLLPNPVAQYYYYDIYFDFGIPGQSDKDLKAKVKINENGTFELLELV